LKSIYNFFSFLSTPLPSSLSLNFHSLFAHTETVRLFLGTRSSIPTDQFLVSCKSIFLFIVRVSLSCLHMPFWLPSCISSNQWLCGHNRIVFCCLRSRWNFCEFEGAFSEFEFIFKGEGSQVFTNCMMAFLPNLLFAFWICVMGIICYDA